MIIFVNEERPYLSWLARHRAGFVADALRKPTRKPPVLHRAVCPEVKLSRTKSTHWTTGRHVKACSLDLEELAAWARNEYGVEVVSCAACGPENGARGELGVHDAADHDHLTRLGKEIVDCVLDVAVVYLDGGAPGYALTVGDIAELLGRTPGQMTAAFLRLVADGFLTVELGDRHVAPDSALPVDFRVYPTVKALRTLPAFARMRVRDVEREHQHFFAAEG